METLQDLKAELKELEKRIDAKLEEEPERGKNRWKPEYGKMYFYVSQTGDTKEDVWADYEVDFDRFIHIPIFKTEEEAKFEKERRKVEREIEDWASPFEVGRENHYFYYNHSGDEVHIATEKNIKRCGHHFASEQDALDCLEAVGEERVKKYYLEVE